MGEEVGDEADGAGEDAAGDCSGWPAGGSSMARRPMGAERVRRMRVRPTDRAREWRVVLAIIRARLTASSHRNTMVNGGRVSPETSASTS